MEKRNIQVSFPMYILFLYLHLKSVVKKTENLFHFHALLVSPYQNLLNDLIFFIFCFYCYYSYFPLLENNIQNKRSVQGISLQVNAHNIFQ